jgi:hypothetical protein
MKTYPIKLRQKIAAGVDQRLGAYEEIAEMFGIAEKNTFINYSSSEVKLAALPHCLAAERQRPGSTKFGGLGKGPSGVEDCEGVSCITLFERSI